MNPTKYQEKVSAIQMDKGLYKLFTMRIFQWSRFMKNELMLFNIEMKVSYCYSVNRIGKIKMTAIPRLIVDVDQWKLPHISVGSMNWQSHLKESRCKIY
jgi:hypothetical protein